MAIPTSPISLANLQSEFGGVNPISLSEYYKGGPYVSTASTQVPTSGVISLGDFSGVSAAANGDVTLVYSGSTNGTFDPGVEDVNRHFVLVGIRFSGSALSDATTPTINGTSMTLITRGVGNGGGDGGISGVYTIKIPTGIGLFTIAQTGTIFTHCAIYRVTGIVEMTTSTVLSSQSGTSLSGSKASSSNGCFFGGSVSNFAIPGVISPSSSGLSVLFNSSDGGRVAASNSTTGPTQTVSLTGNQINSYAIFGYDLF